jgi:hypothetical protein
MDVNTIGAHLIMCYIEKVAVFSPGGFAIHMVRVMMLASFFS